jgi:hypothetical protein
MTLESKYYSQSRINDHRVQQKKYITGHNRVFYSEVADYALTLIKNMVTNNAEVNKNPPKELIIWVCDDTAELASEELLNRGWAHEAPSIDEMYEEGEKVGFK